MNARAKNTLAIGKITTTQQCTFGIQRQKSKTDSLCQKYNSVSKYRRAVQKKVVW